ncbi:galactosyl transferase GMA12/MNN10 protein [Pyrenophora tritici-repentis]|nr:galactosyl transferase GMA12/MNN10 protein [Pyrenophora tritici-repentis]
MLRAAAFIPKVLIALLFLGILYELPWKTSDLDVPTKSWLKDTIKEHATLLLGDNTITSITGTRPAGPKHEHSDDATAPTIKPAEAEQKHTDNATAPTIQPAEAEQEHDDSAIAPAIQPAEPEPEHTGDAAPAIDWNKIHLSYGTAQCMPDFDDQHKQLALERRASCDQHAPFPTEESRRVALATISTGKRIPAYDGAIQTQMFHAAVHGTSAHVLCEDLAPGAWNKIAYLQHLTLTELLKPEDERLEWILWIDRDAIVLDACRPLSSFLPPNSPEFDKYHIITNHDMNGLNAGVFLFRVNKWSSMFFSAVLAYPLYYPDVDLGFAEQTAMQLVLSSAEWKDHQAIVPQHWFNLYPDGDQSVPAYISGVERPNLESWRVRRGDFVLHFAGNNEREKIMLDWYDLLAETGNIWETGVTRDITAEIKQYWDHLGHASNDEKKPPKQEYAPVLKGPKKQPKPPKEERPTEVENKKPPKEQHKKPTEEKKKPTEGEYKKPTQGENKKPAQGENKKPAQGENKKPAQGENKKPAQGENKKPAQGENKEPQKEVGKNGAGDAKDSAAVGENEPAKKKEQKQNQEHEQKEKEHS